MGKFEFEFPKIDGADDGDVVDYMFGEPDYAHQDPDESVDYPVAVDAEPAE